MQDFIIPYEKSPNREILIAHSDLKKALATLNTVRNPVCKKILEWMDWVEVHEQKRQCTAIEISKRLELGQKHANHYLALLKKARVLKAEKESHFVVGRKPYVYYSLHRERIEQISRWIEEHG